jgi:hypothetical protein
MRRKDKEIKKGGTAGRQQENRGKKTRKRKEEKGERPDPQ